MSEPRYPRLEDFQDFIQTLNPKPQTQAFVLALLLLLLGCGGDMDDNLPCSFCVSSCGGIEYNPSTHFCRDGQTYSCNNKPYDPAMHFCHEGQTYSCNNKPYDPAMHFCHEGQTYSCNNQSYDPASQFCSDNSVYSKCGGSVYDPSTQFCLGSNIYSKCGGTVTFTPSTEQCCGSDKYAISNQRCGSGNVIETKCGTDNWYNAETQFCNADNTVHSRCGSSDYNTSTQYCSNGTVKNYGSIVYYGKTYKTVVIGTQTWMTENLNYNATGSVCYGNQENNCNIYGRLYDWSAAIAACPSGWHLPSNAEWDALYRYADGTSGTNSPYSSSTAGKYLKAVSGWNDGGNSTDEFGFAALPGGYGYSGGSFSDVDYYGGWWSASEFGAKDAYSRGIYYGSGYADWHYEDKSYLCSVRCVED
jgi:uncharacterized protein (TIGR02145 family)